MANYSKHPLDYSYERVRRAEEHIVDLQKQVDNIFKMQRDASGAYFDPNPPHELRTSLPPETFVVMRFGVVVGEVAYNLRAALDYLVFQLASLDSGSEQSDTQFPISDDPDKFKSNANRRLKGVSAEHVQAIEQLQPYNGVNWTAKLRDISNPDKHKRLAAIKGTTNITAHDSRNNLSFSRTLGDLRRVRHPVDGDVDVKLFSTHSILFDNEQPVVETLIEIRDNVLSTLDSLKPEFP